MLYVTCPTCQNLLGDKQLLWEQKTEEINNNKNLSDDEKKKAIEKVLDDL